MSYIDLGFNENLSIAGVGQQGQQLDPAQVEQMIPEMSASKLSGFIKSQNGQLQMDLDGNSFVVTDGVVERVRFGKLLDGTYGLLIKDNNDSTLMQIGEKNIIQSILERIILNLTEGKFILRDKNNNTLINIEDSKQQIISADGKFIFDFLNKIFQLKSGNRNDNIFKLTESGIDFGQQDHNRVINIKFYNGEGTLTGDFDGDTTDRYGYFHLSGLIAGTGFRIYEDPINLTGQILDVNIDDGLIMSSGKNITLKGTGGIRTVADQEASLYVDQSGGKDRLLVKFNTGVAQVLATEP